MLKCGNSGVSGLSGLVERDYSRKVLSYNPIAYWPLWETSGSAAWDLVVNLRAPDPLSRDGTYVGVTLGEPGIGDGNTSVLLDGNNDYINIFSAGLAAAFNGAAGTAAIWARVFDLATWSDGTIRKALLLRADVNNRIFLHKVDVPANDWRHEYRAGGVIEGQNTGGLTSTDWIHYAVTWDKVADEVRSFIAGTQSGPTADTLGVWAGALSNVRTLIGANSMVPANVWHGWLAHGMLLDYALAPAGIADLAVVP